MKNLNFKHLCIVAIALFALSACDKSDDPTTEETSAGFALWLVTDSEDFSGMLVTSEEMFSGEVDPTEENYSLLGMARNCGSTFNGDIYNPFNLSGDAGVQKLSYVDNVLTENGFISGGDSRTMYEVVSETKGYYSDKTRSETALQTFNPTTMARTGEIDIADAMAPYMTDEVASTRLGSFMIESEGYLYTQVFFLDETAYGHVYDSTFVAVFDVATDEFVNLAIYPDYIWAGYERKNMGYVTTAPNGDVYISSITGNSADGPHSRCMRFKAGETDFDEWILDYNDIIGEEGSFSMGGPTIHDGKMYLRLKESGMKVDYSNMTDIDVYAYVVDMETLEATKIEGIPASISSVLYSVTKPIVVDDLIYFVVSTPDYQGFYSYNPSTGATAEAFSLTGGIPYQLLEID